MSFFSFNSTVRIRLVLQFITTMATMSVTPYLVIYFSNNLGAVVTGFMFLGVMAASIVGTIIGGFVSDHIGRKKVIVLAEALVSMGFVGAALANSPFTNLPYVTFLLFLMIHFSTGAAEPAYQALIIDVSNKENRRSIYTFSYWFRNLAIALGGMLGAFLFDDFIFFLFLGVALTTLISLFVTIFFIEETFRIVPGKRLKEQEGELANRLSMFKSYKHVLKHKAFRALVFGNLLILSIEEQLTNVIGIRLKNELAEPQSIFPFLPLEVDGVNMIGILKSENTILVVCLTVVVSIMMKKLADRFVLLVGLLLYFAGFTVISFSSIPSTLMIAMFFASLGELMHIPVKQALLANMVPDHARSKYMAIYSLFSIVGVSTAGIFIIISAWIPAVFITVIFGVMGLTSILLFTWLTKEVQPERGRDMGTGTSPQVQSWDT
ncbi:MFS transporter [Bacillus marinisedimentorum]|uniref:MFS transporter n=1 Tax=Bacillus marinisedimentorum TaxID=1821260 RepID=UPI000871C5E7|nr:MFS transporter [Bacillus marinisedimentorum]